MSFFKRPQKAETDRDRSHQQKMEESQKALLDAATATAEAAHEVTTRLKDRLDDSIKRFETTARILNDALIVCDMDGTIHVNNPAAKRIFGGKITGLPVTDLFDRAGEDLTLDHLWTLIADENHWQPSAEHPLRGRRLNDELFWIRPSITRLDWSDKTSSMLILVGDVSNIVEARDESKAADRRYRSIFESSFDGILVVQNGVIVAANPSASVLFGYDCDHMLGRSMFMLFEESDREKIEAATRRHVPVIGITEDGERLNLIYRGTEIVWNGEASKLITVKEVNASRLLR